jgi:hypothetical protein
MARLARAVRFLALLFALGASSRLIAADGGDVRDTTLEYLAYRSPSGNYTLSVYPDDFYGHGGATYRLVKDGKLVWSKALPFAFRQAAVTDSGVSAGYLISGRSIDPGSLQIVILDAGGAVRTRHAIERHRYHFANVMFIPVVDGLLIDEPADRLIVRTHDYLPEETWWMYRLSTGARLKAVLPLRLMPAHEALEQIVDAQAVRGTPLVLVHWRELNRDNESGARFALVDADAGPVWSLGRPRDEAIPDDPSAQRRLHDWIDVHGSILRVDQANRFDLMLDAGKTRATFAVTKDAAGQWQAAEVARAPFAAPERDEPKQSAIPKLALKKLGSITLDPKLAKDVSAVRNVLDFVFDGQGRIAVLRDENDNAATLVLVDQSGNLLREIRLAPQATAANVRWSGLCWTGRDQFIVTQSGFGAGAKAQAWRVDVGTGKARPFAPFDCPAIDRLVGSADGSFVTLSALQFKDHVEHAVIGFDAQGREKWRLREGTDNKNPATLHSPQDIALSSDGLIAVLENVTNRIKCFDREGRFVRSFDLLNLGGGKRGYYLGLCPWVDGGFYLSDYGGDPPFVQVSRAGLMAGGFNPIDTDGALRGTLRMARPSPDWSLWTTDGQTLIRFSQLGLVDRIFGEELDPQSLGHVAMISVDGKGRIYAVASRSGAVHVFDASAKKLRVCLTRPHTYHRLAWSPSVTANDQGEVFLGIGLASSLEDSRHYAHFSVDGAWRNDVEFPSADCRFQPGTGLVAIRRSREVVLLDSDGKMVRNIRIRGDRRPLEYPVDVAFAPDGSIAIMADREGGTEMTVNLYRANGDPQKAILVPSWIGFGRELAYDGRRLVVSGSGALVIFDSEGMPVARSDPPLRQGSTRPYYPYLLPGGHELTLWNGKDPVLHRFELP